MSGIQRLDAHTATLDQSVWQPLSRKKFLQNVVDLHRASNKIPSDPKVHTRIEWPAARIRNDSADYVLPFKAEQRLADDLAFIAAAEEGVKAISAVGLEQTLETHGLVVRLAANEVIPQELPDTFEKIFDLLSRCATRQLSREACTERLFVLVLTLNLQRIHGRLQSKYWKRPSHRVFRSGVKEKLEPLNEELRKLSRRFRDQSSTHRAGSMEFFKQLDSLCNSYQKIDTCQTEAETVDMLKAAIKQSHTLCMSRGSTIEETISSYGFVPELICQDKRIRQISKIGRYWGLCLDMVDVSRRYRSLFQHVVLRTIQPYHGVAISLDGTSMTCYVHAEIQLLTFYDMYPDLVAVKPRVLGVSKAACYLCDLFIINHGKFFFTKTHGQLYHEWTVPDLVEFNSDHRNDFRRVLAAMNKEIQTTLNEERKRPSRQNRPYPLGSYLTLPIIFPQLSQSPVPSTLSSIGARSATESPGRDVVTVRSGTRESEPQPISGQGGSAPHIQCTMPTPQPTITCGPTAGSHRLTSSLLSHEPSLHEPGLDTELNSDVTLRCARKASPTLSPIIIRSWELPIERAISVTSPFQVSVGNLSVGIEFDGPSQGLVTVTSIAKSTTQALQNLIDVNSMDPNELLDVSRADGDDSLTVNLNYDRPHSMQVTFQWP